MPAEGSGVFLQVPFGFQSLQWKPVGSLNIFAPNFFAPSREQERSNLSRSEVQDLPIEIHIGLSQIAGGDSLGYENNRNLADKIFRVGPASIPLLRSYIEELSSELPSLEASVGYRPNGFTTNQIRAMRRARAFAMHVLEQIQNASQAP